jgi:predicted Zn-dependent peptidase
MKTKFYAALAAGLVTIMTPQNSLAGHPELEKLGQIKFSVPPVSRYALDNGLIVYILKDNTLPVIHVSALVRSGSAYDPAGKTGLAQMTANLMKDGGTKKYTAEDLDKTLEYLGASLDISAYTEETSVDMTSLKKDFDKVLDIYADVFRNPVFEDSKIEINRDEELEVIRRRNDSPSKASVREARRMFFGVDHPYGRRSELETIKSVTKADLAAFHSEHFLPNNTILAISGDFASEAEMLAKIKEKFGGWARADVPSLTVPPPAFSGGRKVYFIDKDTAQAFLVVVQKGLERTNPDNYQLSVLSDILGGGFQSRLFNEVRTKRGLAYDVSAGVAGLRKNGFAITTCGTKPQTYSQAMSEILNQLSLVGKEAVSKEELERSKGSIINPFVFKFSTPQRLALQRAAEEYYGQKKGYLDSYVEDISKVDTASTLAIGKKVFDPDNALIFVIGNSKKFDKPLSEFGPVTELKED